MDGQWPAEANSSRVEGEAGRSERGIFKARRQSVLHPNMQALGLVVFAATGSTPTLGASLYCWLLWLAPAVPFVSGSRTVGRIRY